MERSGHLAKTYQPTFCYAAYRGLCPELDLGDASDVRVCRNDRCSLDKDNVVPVLNVGLWPFLQLMLLVPLAIWIAALISQRFDESLTSE